MSHTRVKASEPGEAEEAMAIAEASKATAYPIAPTAETTGAAAESQRRPASGNGNLDQSSLAVAWVLVGGDTGTLVAVDDCPRRMGHPLVGNLHFPGTVASNRRLKPQLYGHVGRDFLCHISVLR
jgi:hypothetical protein